MENEKYKIYLAALLHTINAFYRRIPRESTADPGKLFAGIEKFSAILSAANSVWAPLLEKAEVYASGERRRRQVQQQHLCVRFSRAWVWSETGIRQPGKADLNIAQSENP